MATPQEWLKRVLNEYAPGVDEEKLEKIIEEYNNEFGSQEDKINWLKEKLEGYIPGEEEYLESIIEEYDEIFGKQKKRSTRKSRQRITESN